MQRRIELSQLPYQHGRCRPAQRIPRRADGHSVVRLSLCTRQPLHGSEVPIQQKTRSKQALMRAFIGSPQQHQAMLTQCRAWFRAVCTSSRAPAATARLMSGSCNPARKTSQCNAKARRKSHHAVDMSPTINQHSACEKGEASGHTSGGGRIQGCGGGRLLCWTHSDATRHSQPHPPPPHRLSIHISKGSKARGHT